MTKVKGKIIKLLNDNPCKGCKAVCCHDLAMHIGRPHTHGDVDLMCWYLHYDTVDIFIRHHRWYLLIKGKCIYLDKNYCCTIYKKRDERCRRHDSDSCEKNEPYYDILIRTPEELKKYLHHAKKGKYKHLSQKILTK
ncbi:MAG: hypothetical protein GY858_03700 [Candidatus Omnitrophica bacterium]|nr:hypothetical protein [Candidatus Omnitrophota bacterium]